MWNYCLKFPHFDAMREYFKHIEFGFICKTEYFGPTYNFKINSKIVGMEVQ